MWLLPVFNIVEELVEINVLGSGSSGNSYYFPFGDVYNFVDVGVARSLLKPLLDEKTPRHINIFLTHEHLDHIRGLRSLQIMFPTTPMVVYASAPVLGLLHEMESMKRFWLSEFVAPHAMEPNKLYSIPMAHTSSEGNGSKPAQTISGAIVGAASREIPFLNVQTVRALHNSPLGLAFRFDLVASECVYAGDAVENSSSEVDLFRKHEIYENNESIVSIGFLSDTGDTTAEMLDTYSRCRILFLEANYEESLLEKSAYPRAIKQRISSSTGHLSNKQGLQFIERLFATGRLRLLALAHVSENANDYALLESYSNFYQSTYKIQAIVLRQKSFRKIIID